MSQKILIVDDNIRLATSLKRNFELKGISCDLANDHHSAVSNALSTEYSVILLDLRLGDQSGLSVLSSMRENGVAAPVIIITGNATVDSAISALRSGVVDYIKKPVTFTVLWESCSRYFRSEESPATTLRPGSPGLLLEAQKIAHSDLPVLITGESGTGKEVLADFIHAHSMRSGHRMLKQNCASIPESLLESELFGHEKGAFTGAERNFKGIFERADQSTLFLDEIGEMPLEQQSKILRILQDKEVRRIGGEKTIKVDVRFIAATNRPPTELLRTKKIREDLFYRLNAGHIHLLPLRERRDQIPALVETFCLENRVKDGAGERTMSSEVMKLFMEYPWPGNIRELKNVVHYACAMADTREVETKHLPRSVTQTEENLGDSVSGQHGSRSPFAQTERDLIIKVLAKTKYNKKKTAEYLSISRTTLYEKIKKYGIEA